LDPAELEKMLRLGAYHHLAKQDDDVDEAAFYAADIETLLAKNTRKVTVDGVRGTVSLQLTHDTTNAEVQVSFLSSRGTCECSRGCLSRLTAAHPHSLGARQQSQGG